MTTSGEAHRFDANELRAIERVQYSLSMIPAHGTAAAIFDAIAPCMPVAAGMISVVRPHAPGSMVNHAVRMPAELLDTWVSAPPEHLAHALGPILAARPGTLLRDADTIHGEMREQLEALRALGAYGLGEGGGYKVVERTSPAHGPEQVMLTLLTARGDVIPERSKAMLAVLNPAIEAAVRRTELPFAAHRPLFAQMIEAQDQGYVCLSLGGSVLESNRRAHELALRYHARAGIIGQRRALADLAYHAVARPRAAGPWRIRGRDRVSTLQIHVLHLRKEVHALTEDVLLVTMLEWAPTLDPRVAEGLARLTVRQRQIALRLARGGMGAKEIAAELGISPRTVSTHTTAIHEALGVHSRAELVTLFAHLEDDAFPEDD